jgi:hypothetical protein
VTITSFVKPCCEAHGDLAEVARELSDLKMLLELLQGGGDVEDDRILPESLQRQVLGILGNCKEVLVKIGAVLHKQDTAKILDSIERPRTLTAQEEYTDRSYGSSGFMLQHYLDNLTTYAEAVSKGVQYQKDSDLFPDE